MADDYQVFLSYSHADAKAYGEDYINEIKRQIEVSLGEENLVFLDAEALKLGNEWNSKIQRCLDKSKVFICLLSENYLKSEYCTRERLWWAQKEMAKGRLHKATLPVFYIEIRDSADANIKEQLEKLSYLQNDITFSPWFPEGAKITAQELVKKRLEAAKILTRINEIKAASDTMKGSITSIPPYNQKFVGRVNELCKIRQICQHSGMAAESIPVLHGEAGCGKTELSFAYAHGYASEYPGGRFMIPMEHVENWNTAWLKLGDEIDKNTGLPIYRMLGLSEDDRKQSPEKFTESLVTYMVTHIKKSGRTLILLDNIDCIELLTESGLRKLFPSEEIPEDLDLIATTRNTPVVDGCSKAIAVPIGNLCEEAAMELLRLHCGNSPFNQAPPENDKTTADAKELLAFLEYHAWSVEIIAGYLGREYKYGAKPQKVLEQLKQNFEIKTKYGTFRDIPDCVEKLLQPTVDKIKELELGNEILELACAAAMFSPDVVSVKLLEMLWRKRHGEKACSHADSWLWAWETLKAYHLISEENNGTVRMHRTTNSFFQKYGQVNQEKLAEDISKIISGKKYFDFSGEDAKAIAGFSQFILEQSWKENFYSKIISWIECFLLKLYCFDESQKLLKGVENLIKNTDDSDLSSALASARGTFYLNFGDYSQSLEHYKKSLAIMLSVFPENHRDLATSYNNLGLVYKSMGDYAQSLEHFEKSLAIWLESLPENHPDLALSYNNLGCVYE